MLAPLLVAVATLALPAGASALTVGGKTGGLAYVIAAATGGRRRTTAPSGAAPTAASAARSTSATR